MNTTIINSKGVEVTTLDETLKNSSLDWEPMESSVCATDNREIVMTGKKILYRSDNKQALGVVGEDYKSTSPREFVEAQFALAEAIKGKVVRVGFLDDRSRAFSFVQFGEKINIPREKRKVGDPVQAYIYSTDGWDGGTPRRSRLYIERLRCANGMTSREIKADLWVSHTRSMMERYSTRKQTFLEIANKEIATVRQQFIDLAQAHMNEDECTVFLAKLLPGEGKRVENRRAKMLELFKTGEGNTGTSRYDAYNAVTEFVTHHRNYRETDNTSVETNRFLGVLETDTLSRQALSLLQGQFPGMYS